jgi:CheY-like chemotaxis protein
VSADQDPSTDQRHILAVNNSEEVLGVFRLLLEEEGYRVTTQSYLLKDMDEVRTLKPDLIVLDYMWSEEDGGWSMLQMLQMDRATAKTPIILCTGAKREISELGDHLTQMGVTIVLKPFDIDTLLEAIAKGLGGGSGQAMPTKL